MNENQADSQRYQVIFSGEILPDQDLGQVKRAIAQLFKKELSEIERFFSGEPVIVKSGVDQVTAKKYEAAFKKAGARCELSLLSVAEAPVNNPSETESSEDSKPSQPPEPTFRVAPVGARIGPRESVERPPNLEIDHIDMLPVGSDIGDHEAVEAVELPSIDHIAFIPNEGPIVEAVEDTTQPPSTDHLAALPVGELELDDEEVDPPAPNIDHLSCVPHGEKLAMDEAATIDKVPDISHLEALPNEGTPQGLS